MRRNRSRLSSAGRSRYGLLRPGSVSVPRYVADLVGGQAVDVGLAVADQLLRVAGTAARSSRRRRYSRSPQSKPSQRTSSWIDFDVLDVFLRRVGVVEAQVAEAAELRGDAEIQADRLGVADVQVAVRLGRKPRVHAAAVLSRCAGPRR